MTRNVFFVLVALLHCIAISIYGQQPPSYPATGKVLSRSAATNQQQQIQISGRVFDKAAEKSIAGINVQLTDIDSSFRNMRTVTNADGAYSFALRQTRNFRIEVWFSGNNAGYEQYSSPVYNTVSLLQSKQTALPAIYLTPTKKPDNNTTSDGYSYPQKPPSRRDTIPTQKEVYLNQKLFKEAHVLPTPSAYALYYALNPGLKDMTSIPANYNLVQPQTPPFTQVLKKQFTSLFKKDSDEDPEAQQLLRDSTSAYINLYKNVFRNTTISYANVNRDSLKTVLSAIVTDASAYQNKMGSARKAKAERITNIMVSCGEILRAAIDKKEINRTEYEELVGLGSYLSTLVESSGFLEYFRELLNKELGSGYYYRQRSFQDNLSPQFAAFHESTSDANDDVPDKPPLFNDGRAFTVSVYVLETNGHIRQSENEAEQRYLVSFYPPALRAIKRMYIDCSPLATFGRVTLHEGKYEQKVIDTFTGKELDIISSGGKTFDTRPAFSQPAKPLLGDVNFTEIKVFVKE